MGLNTPFGLMSLNTIQWSIKLQQILSSAWIKSNSILAIYSFYTSCRE